MQKSLDFMKIEGVVTAMITFVVHILLHLVSHTALISSTYNIANMVCWILNIQALFKLSTVMSNNILTSFFHNLQFNLQCLGHVVWRLWRIQYSIMLTKYVATTMLILPYARYCAEDFQSPCMYVVTYRDNRGKCFTLCVSNILG